MSKEWNRNLTNNSGQGKDAVVLDINEKKFNWGAFFFNFIWGIFNNTFITLIVIPVAFIPIIGGILCFGLQIWFGIMGNKWAWQNKQWKSVEHFHQVQKRWAIATAVLFTFTILCALLAVLTPFLISAPGSKYDHTKKMGLNILHQNTLIMETKDIKCGLTSAELTKCFAKQMNIEEFIDERSFKEPNGNTWIFVGDGMCNAEAGGCYALFNNIKLGSLYVKENGYLSIK